MERYWVKPASHWGGVEILHEKIFYPTFLGSLDEELEFVCFLGEDDIFSPIFSDQTF